jgi:tetratricopeptide (TPR) repeat protein
LEVFGKRGERQYGIDVLDLGGEKSIYAAQCKLKEEHKSLSPSEIQAEVDQAKLFNPPLSRYAILTTAKISAHSQRKIREINQSHKDLGLFEVELFTWDDLCPLLQQYSEIQEQFYSDIVPRRARRMEAQLVAINEGLQSLTSRGGENEIDSQINDARDCISKREFQLATLLLNRVQRTSDDKLTPYQRFRVLSNLAAAALGSGKTGIAAKLFLEARTHEPNNELGKINEVLAYLLAGDPNSCYEKASVLRKEYPGSARLAALWLTSAPKEISLSVLESEINSVLLTDAEVCAALARRAVMALALDKALEYADSANKLAPAWSQPHLIRAQALLGSALHIQFGFRGTTAPQENSLLEAEEECSKALETAQLEKDEQTEKMALVLRVDIRLMLKKKDEAIKDAADAERLDPQDPQIMLAMAEAYIASDRREDAISILERAFRLTGDPSIAFVLGRSLYNRGRETDIDQAIRVMRQVSIQDIRPELRPTYATQTFQCLTKAQDWTAAETYLAEVSPFLDPVLPPVFRGYLAHFQERPEQAEAHATEARSLLAANTNPDTEDYLARLFMLIGRPADALPLWRNLFDTKAPAFDPGNLLNCAARLHKDDVVMQTCEELHARG